MKKILFISHSSSESGGAEDEFLRMLKYFSRLSNYEVYTACPEGARSEEFQKYSKQNYNYRWGWVPVANEGLFSYVKYFIKGFSQTIQFHRIFKSQKFDLCVINVCVLFWPAVIAKLFKVNSLIFIRETIVPLFIRKYYYFLLNRIAVHFIAVSDFNKTDFVNITNKYNIDVLYSSIEDDAIPAPNIISLSGHILDNMITDLVSQNKFKILHIGPVSNRKNQLLTVKTADYLINKVGDPDFRFYFIGDNYTDKQVVKIIMKFIKQHNLGNHCFFTGVLNRNDLFQFYLHSDAVVMPSLSEGLPLTLVDAFKFKIPVLSANCCGMADIIINYENGFIIDYDAAKFGDKIIELKRDISLYDKIINNGYSTYENKFNLKKNMIRLEEITRKLCA